MVISLIRRLSKSNTNDEIEKKLSLISPIISDLSQISLAVAIGLFGILAISVGIDQVLDEHVSIWQLQEKEQQWIWALPSRIILSIAYFGLVLLGAICMIQHKFYSLLKEKYISENYKDHITELKEVAKSNWLIRNSIYPSLDKTGDLRASLSGMIRIVLIPFLVISVALGAIIMVL